MVERISKKCYQITIAICQIYFLESSTMSAEKTPTGINAPLKVEEEKYWPHFHL